MREDVVAGLSQRICDHMNSDHADAVAHLCMFHARLPRLPPWSAMESISATTMVLQYKSPEAEYDASSARLCTIHISFDPPLESSMDARKRLVAMSRESEEQNRNHYKQVRNKF
mgnify:FL=1